MCEKTQNFTKIIKPAFHKAASLTDSPSSRSSASRSRSNYTGSEPRSIEKPRSQSMSDATGSIHGQYVPRTLRSTVRPSPAASLQKSSATARSVKSSRQTSKMTSPNKSASTQEAKSPRKKNISKWFTNPNKSSRNKSKAVRRRYERSQKQLLSLSHRECTETNAFGLV